MNEQSDPKAVGDDRVSDDAFRAHFENLPDPAYLWGRAEKGYALLALNRAARRLPHAKISTVTAKARDRLLSDPVFVADMEHCLLTGEVVAREVTYTYYGTGITRLLATTHVRLSADMLVVHARDITDARAAEREVIDVIETERRRIGRDLHDGLGQELTGISLSLKTLSKQLARDNSPHEAAVRHINEMIRKSIVDTRRVSRILSPGFSAEVRLGETLNALAAEINEHSDMRCRVRCSGLGNWHDEEAATHLLRIAQEGVNNALRHSRASEIELYCGLESDSLVLEIRDDGIGIPPEPERVEGLGLRSMRYRARMLNATLEIAQRVSGGTRVQCACPLGML